MQSPTHELTRWLDTFGTLLERGDSSAALALFQPESYWRDLVAFTWNIKTMEGADAIGAMLDTTLAHTLPSNWQIEGDANIESGWFGEVTAGRFTFETNAGRGKGHIRLKDGKCWTILTTLQELTGFEEKAGRRRPNGVEHGAFRDRKNWLERKQQEEAELGYTKQPYCVIIGGGQAGIGLGARLKRLEVPTIIVEQNERAGDSWRKRYKSLCLHDPVWYDHMPYMPYPDHWPIFTPKDQMGDWLEMYTKVMALNYWSSTECLNARYDDAQQEWNVNVVRDGENVTLYPKHLILATGMSGKPNVPEIPGAETFVGALHHSSQYTSGELYRGKRCVVLGSNNSAHDICTDLWESGAAEVSMIQRSSSLVAKSETQFGNMKSYSEDAVEQGITTEMADLMGSSMPYALQHFGAQEACSAMKKTDAEFYRELEAAGFLLDFGDDESGLGMKYLRRGSGYYIDVGASDLIINGEIKLYSGVNIERVNERAVVLTDATELPADLVVLATGYGSMNGWAAKLISQEVADKVGKVWGLGSNTTKDPGPWEGEQRNMWKPTQQNSLWFTGGNLAQSRHYSLFLALQLKARFEEVATPVYGLQEVYHLS